MGDPPAWELCKVLTTPRLKNESCYDIQIGLGPGLCELTVMLTTIWRLHTLGKRFKVV